MRCPHIPLSFLIEWPTLAGPVARGEGSHVVSSPSPSKPEHDDQPDYSKAYAVLNNPKYVTDIDALQRFLDALGVGEADDLADLDEEDLGRVFTHLKKISLKKFHRFLCRDVDPSLWAPR